MRPVKPIGYSFIVLAAALHLAVTGFAQTTGPDPTQGEATFAEPKAEQPQASGNASQLTQQGAAEQSFPDLAKHLQDVLRQTVANDKVAPEERIKLPINVGSMILRVVELHPLPRQFAEFMPKYRDFGYFVLADGTIGIVNPGPYQIAELYAP